METRGTGRESNGREIARWSDAGDVVVGSSRGCVVVEVRARDESVFLAKCKSEVIQTTDDDDDDAVGERDDARGRLRAVV